MTLMRRAAAAGLGAAVLAWTAPAVPRAQTAEPRIWQGIYSEAQAERGRQIFTNSCLRCHGADLAGTTAPALSGDRFHASFGQDPLDRLFLKIRDTMPPNFGGTVDDQGKLDVVAYILKRNGYPSGASDLKLASEDLATARVLRKGEQARVQNFALVQTVGCLSRGAGDTWVLTRSSDPVTTREDAASPQSLAAAASRTLGARTFRLLNAKPFAPESHVGQKMEARGLVYVDGSEARLTVTSLQTAASSCGA